MRAMFALIAVCAWAFSATAQQSETDIDFSATEQVTTAPAPQQLPSSSVDENTSSDMLDTVAQPVQAATIIPADIVIWNGPIYTGRDDVNANEGAEKVSAVAVRGGRIVFVGSQDDAQRYVGTQTTVIDLAGAALYPGFVDAHAHLVGVGAREISLNLANTDSLKALLAKLENWIASHDDPVITGRGWIETHWPEARMPSRWDLDKVAPNRPVLLTRADGHALVANSAALRAAGIDGQRQPPAGGSIAVNHIGEATGILIDKAMGLVAPLVPVRDQARQQQEITVGADVYAQRGWTGMHNMSVPLDEALMMGRMSDTGQLGIRLYNSIEPSDADRLFDMGPYANANGRVTTRAIKLYMDGALGSRGAALLAPYSDADSRGLLTLDEAATKRLMKQALERGIQINTHAIGDRGNRLLLDWVSDVRAEVLEQGLDAIDARFRIEHAQIFNAEDISRVVALGMIPSMQPSHAISDLHFAPDRLGDERLSHAYAWRSLLDAGAIIAGGSDAPVEVGSPLIEFYAAISRRDLEGYQGDNWHAEQAVSRLEALRMFTLWPAVASFAENDLGTIEVGKKADFTGFDRDLMVVAVEEIPTAQAVLTVVDGDIIYPKQ